MKTVFISANDTGSGKTFVTAALACRLVMRGQRVQVVKVVETGISDATPTEQTDAGFVQAFVTAHAGQKVAAAQLSTHTLLRFHQPIAPVDAARHDGTRLDFDALVTALHTLPTGGAQWRLVEGAGGLAVPLEEKKKPRDWADFSLTISATVNVLVVPDRLGAINQARLLAAYATQKQLPACGLWLNANSAETAANIRCSNAAALQGNTSGLPLLAIHNHNELWPQTTDLPWLA